MKTNYHTHNFRCNHAIGNVEDYIKIAIEEGFDEIGISDHLPHPGKDIDNQSRMTYEEIPEYFSEIDHAIKKYGDKISIKKGIEGEYFEDFKWFYEELKQDYNIDYMILGVHFFPYEGQWFYVGHIDFTPEVLKVYVDHVIKSMESGLFRYIAHPDLFGISYRDWDEHAIKQSRRIFEAANRLNMPLEINVNGMNRSKVEYNNGTRYQYPIKDFWELAKEYNVKVIVGIDAHSPDNMRNLSKGIDFAKEIGLDVIDHLEF